MTSARIRVVSHPRGKSIHLAISRVAKELYDALAEASGLSIYRLRVTKGSDWTLVPNSKKITIKEVGIENQSLIHVKDLGPQISWRTVFIAEYLGPILIPGLFLFPLRPYLYYNYDTITEPSGLQLLLCALLTIHFVKREYESIFVHRFSLALFAFGELANLNTHLVLRDLRRPDTTERGVPHGFGFGVVTCPNYLFEIISWMGIYLVSGLSWSILIFIIIGSVQMGLWAKKKERRYREEFGGKYKVKRFVMLPGIV
ncbi:steroid alpha reductase family protein [Aspergillus bombycis]|uniref:Steroid alpha reductase family protein n=1 Tax=Aspergillus bombycis TaxID=109264 RepID=A0A1F8ADL5_9EURO|nr:steroid alpha reductase family protein [Aspergillus bombycis]OGM49455.1 steroid alpha reductase family protein [Aspergillus bombycis]